MFGCSTISALVCNYRYTFKDRKGNSRL